MTREEAIRALRYERKTALHENKSAFDMAIKFLSAEPCDDAISRQVVLEEMEKRRKEGDCITKGFINKLPSVTPKQKIGRWIHFAWSDDCSECGWSTGKYGSPTKFCPNCGAKMEVSENG